MSGTKIEKVPESVCLLRNLLALELGKSNHLQEIPESIGELEHLRHLGLSHTAITRLPKSIGRLCNLQNLELEGCKKLKVKDFCVENYGVNLPSWVTDSAFSRLETLRISGCQSCKVIPFLSQLPHLSELVVSHCLVLEELTHVPPSLRKFEVRQCPKLGTLPIVNSLSDLEVGGGSGAIFKWIKKLPSLSSLTVSHFSGLVHLNRTTFQCLTSLTILKVKGCQKLASLGHNGGLTDLTSLVCLEISSCPKLTSIPELPAGLQFLTIKDCRGLQQQCRRVGADWTRVQCIPNLKI